MLSVVAKHMASFAVVNDLANLNKIVVGPNAIAVSDPRPMLRVGIWIVDADFPHLELQPPSPPDFPLPRLTDDAAAGSFALVPLLSPPPPGGVPPADNPLFGFAMSAPTSTLQLILDAMFPKIAAQAADHHFTVESAVITTDSSGAVTTTLSGSLPLDISMTASLTENLGTVQVPNTVQMMPAVVSSSHSTSVGDLLDWFIGTLVPAIGLLLVGELSAAAYGVGVASDKANGIIGSYLGSLPSILPFRNSSLPSEGRLPQLAVRSAGQIFISDGCVEFRELHDRWRRDRRDRHGGYRRARPEHGARAPWWADVLPELQLRNREHLRRGVVVFRARRRPDDMACHGQYGYERLQHQFLLASGKLCGRVSHSIQGLAREISLHAFSERNGNVRNRSDQDVERLGGAGGNDEREEEPAAGAQAENHGRRDACSFAGGLKLGQFGHPGLKSETWGTRL